ncbi:MAG: hypothetical protein V6Z89_09615 [Desulfobacter sp.]
MITGIWVFPSPGKSVLICSKKRAREADIPEFEFGAGVVAWGDGEDASLKDNVPFSLTVSRRTSVPCASGRPVFTVIF